MDELTPEQYETVLKYMETVNEDSFEAAAQTLSHHNYNLQVPPPPRSEQSTVASATTPLRASKTQSTTRKSSAGTWSTSSVATLSGVRWGQSSISSRF